MGQQHSSKPISFPTVPLLFFKTGPLCPAWDKKECGLGEVSFTPEIELAWSTSGLDVYITLAVLVRTKSLIRLVSVSSRICYL